MRDINAALPDTAFWRTYGGRFSGVLSWDDFDALWNRLAAAEAGWFVFDPTGDAPDTPQGATEFAATLDEARGMLEQVRGRPYCGAVFVDDIAAPTFVKVFDPYRMGAVCGSSGDRVMPRWVFCRIAPDALPLVEEPPAKKGLLARLVG